MTLSSKCKPRRISGGVFLCLICIPVILFFRCNGSGSVAAIYVPPVTFSGDLNETAVYLPGNIIHPNTCFLDNSILKMDFYSTDYDPSNTPTGRHLKLWVYPPRPADSNQIKIVTDRIVHTIPVQCRGFELDNVSNISYTVAMKTMTVAVLKSQFSHVVEGLVNGDEFLIEYGKSHKKLGVIIPYNKYAQKKRKLGLVEGKATYSIKGDFKITNEELLNL